MAKKKVQKLTDEELLSPLPALSLPKKEEVVFPNADNTLAAQKEFLELRLAAVLGMEMNDANLEKVKTVKKGIVGWRNTFKKQCATGKEELKEYVFCIFSSRVTISRRVRRLE
jgi:hypothetical protein